MTARKIFAILTWSYGLLLFLMGAACATAMMEGQIVHSQYRYGPIDALMPLFVAIIPGLLLLAHASREL